MSDYCLTKERIQKLQEADEADAKARTFMHRYAELKNDILITFPYNTVDFNKSEIEKAYSSLGIFEHCLAQTNTKYRLERQFRQEDLNSTT